MATLMLDGGADIRHIQEMLGHAELSTTQIYTHVSLRNLKAVHAATHPAASNTPPRQRQASGDDGGNDAGAGGRRDTGHSQARASLQGNGSRDPYRAPQARDPQHQHPARPPTAPVPQPFFAACRFCLPALSSKPGRPGSPCLVTAARSPSTRTWPPTVKPHSWHSRKHRRRQPTPTPLDDSPRDFPKASHTAPGACYDVPPAVVTASMPCARGRCLIVVVPPPPTRDECCEPDYPHPWSSGATWGAVVGLQRSETPCRRGRAACRLCSASAHLAAHLAAHQQAASGGRGRALRYRSRDDDRQGTTP